MRTHGALILRLAVLGLVMASVVSGCRRPAAPDRSPDRAPRVAPASSSRPAPAAGHGAAAPAGAPGSPAADSPARGDVPAAPADGAAAGRHVADAGSEPPGPGLAGGDGTAPGDAPDQEPVDVPSVLRQWRATGDRAAALERLGPLAAGSPESRETLIRLAGGADRDARLLAAEALALSGAPGAAEQLAALIVAAPPGDLRTDLVEATARLADAAAAPYLFEIIRVSGEPDLLQAAQRALANLCDEALFGEVVGRYLAAVESGDDVEQDTLLGIVRHLAKPEAAPWLAAWVMAPGTDFGAPLPLAAVDTLGTLGTADAAAVLMDLIDGAGEGRRDVPALAVERISNPEALPLLKAVASGAAGRSAPARLAALAALRNYEPDAYAPLVRDLARAEPDPVVRAAAAAVLRDAGL